VIGSEVSPLILFGRFIARRIQKYDAAYRLGSLTCVGVSEHRSSGLVIGKYNTNHVFCFNNYYRKKKYIYTNNKSKKEGGFI